MVTVSVFVVVNHATQPSTPPLSRTTLVKLMEVEIGVAEVALGLIAFWISLTGASATGSGLASICQAVAAMLLGPVRSDSAWSLGLSRIGVSAAALAGL